MWLVMISMFDPADHNFHLSDRCNDIGVGTPRNILEAGGMLYLKESVKLHSAYKCNDIDVGIPRNILGAGGKD